MFLDQDIGIHFLSTYRKESFGRYLNYWLHIPIKSTVGISRKASLQLQQVSIQLFLWFGHFDLLNLSTVKFKTNFNSFSFHSIHKNKSFKSFS